MKSTCVPSLLPYLLQRPEGVHHRFDLPLLVEGDEFLHHHLHLATPALLEEQVEEREAGDDFVLLVEFNGVHLLHLPPLGRQTRETRLSPGELIYVSLTMK